MADAFRFPNLPPPTGRRLPQCVVRADAFSLPQKIDNSRLVKVADPRERRAQHRLVLVSLLLSAAILASAYQRFAIIRSGYRLEELKGQREQLLEANRQLHLEEASLRNPERVDAIARAQLGFATPTPSQMRPLEPLPDGSDGAVFAAVHPPPLSRSFGARSFGAQSVGAQSVGAALPTVVP